MRMLAIATALAVLTGPSLAQDGKAQIRASHGKTADKSETWSRQMAWDKNQDMSRTIELSIPASAGWSQPEHIKVPWGLNERFNIVATLVQFGYDEGGTYGDNAAMLSAVSIEDLGGSDGWLIRVRDLARHGNADQYVLGPHEVKVRVLLVVK